MDGIVTWINKVVKAANVPVTFTEVSRLSMWYIDNTSKIPYGFTLFKY